MADGTEQPKNLSLKQRRFIDAYLGIARGNASQAARIAGYSDAQQSGWECKKNQDVLARINERLVAETLSAQEVLAELTDVAKAPFRDFVEVLLRDDDGEPIKVKMDLSSKVKSLELLGKHHQLFSENLNISGGLEIREFVGIPGDTP